MGWAARAKEQKGNPTANPLMMQIVKPEVMNAARAGTPQRVKLGDRAYDIDVKGTFRRTRQVLVAGSMRYGKSGGQ